MPPCAFVVTLFSSTQVPDAAAAERRDDLGSAVGRLDPGHRIERDGWPSRAGRCYRLAVSTNLLAGGWAESGSLVTPTEPENVLTVRTDSVTWEFLRVEAHR